MSELRRLLDESESETEKALLHAGRSYRSSREMRTKTLAALGIAGSTAVMMAGAGASAATAVPFMKLTGAKLLVAASAVGAVALVPVAYHALHRTPAAIAPAQVRSVLASQEVASPRGSEVAVPVPDALASALPRAGTAPRAALAAHGVESVGLAQELAALDAARSTMARGDTQGALLLLDGYTKTCPQGRLKLEAEMLRIDALARSGQTEAARRRAEAFLRRHPGSVLAARARAYADRRGSADD